MPLMAQQICLKSQQHQQAIWHLRTTSSRQTTILKFSKQYHSKVSWYSNQMRFQTATNSIRFKLPDIVVQWRFQHSVLWLHGGIQQYLSLTPLQPLLTNWVQTDITHQIAHSSLIGFLKTSNITISQTPWPHFLELIESLVIEEHKQTLLFRIGLFIIIMYMKTIMLFVSHPMGRQLEQRI